MDATSRLEEANTIELYKNSYTAMYVQVYIQCNDNKGATLRGKKKRIKEEPKFNSQHSGNGKVEAGCLGHRSRLPRR